MAHFKRSHVAIPTATFAMVLGLGLAGAPMNAYGVTSAELQQQLDAASEQLNKLYSQAEQAGYDLHSVQSDLEATKESIVQTEAEIEEEQAQLVELQRELGVLATNQYKGGSLNLFSLLFNADSFDSLVSSMRYADKAAEHQQGVISQSKELQQSLAEQKVKADAASAAASDAQAYYNQLSDEVKAKIREEQEAAREKARQEAEEARKKAELEAQQQAQQGGSSSSGGGSSQSGSGGSSQGGNTGGSTGSGGGSGNTGSGSTGGGSTGGGNTGGGAGGGNHSTSSAAQTMVNRAWGIIGSGYSYSGYKWTGDPNTSWFTCSGVIDYALGLRTNSNSPESLYAAVGSRLTTDRSKLAYGDLVFFRHGGRRPGHVGIYIGNDQMIDSIPGAGVGTRDLDYIGGFMGGGPIV